MQNLSVQDIQIWNELLNKKLSLDWKFVYGTITSQEWRELKGIIQEIVRLLEHVTYVYADVMDYTQSVTKTVQRRPVRKFFKKTEVTIWPLGDFYSLVKHMGKKTQELIDIYKIQSSVYHLPYSNKRTIYGKFLVKEFKLRYHLNGYKHVLENFYKVIHAKRSEQMPGYVLPSAVLATVIESFIFFTVAMEARNLQEAIMYFLNHMLK